jgi:hypothetical protein
VQGGGEASPVMVMVVMVVVVAMVIPIYKHMVFAN